MTKLLHTQGYHNTGVSQILKESGVLKGSLYHHFPGGKAELAVAAVKRANEMMINGIIGFTEQANHDPAGMIEIFCNYFIDYMLENDFQRGRGTPISLMILDAASKEDGIQEQVEIGYKWIIDHLQGLLMQKGMAEEKAYDLANVVLASVEGAMTVSNARRTVEPLKIVRDQLVEQLTQQRDELVA